MLRWWIRYGRLLHWVTIVGVIKEWWFHYKWNMSIRSSCMMTPRYTSIGLEYCQILRDWRTMWISRMGPKIWRDWRSCWQIRLLALSRVAYRSIIRRQMAIHWIWISWICWITYWMWWWTYLRWIDRIRLISICCMTNNRMMGIWMIMWRNWISSWGKPTIYDVCSDNDYYYIMI